MDIGRPVKIVERQPLVWIACDPHAPEMLRQHRLSLDMLCQLAQLRKSREKEKIVEHQQQSVK
jgi:hypothetical protein